VPGIKRRGYFCGSSRNPAGIKALSWKAQSRILSIVTLHKNDSKLKIKDS